MAAASSPRPFSCSSASGISLCRASPLPGSGWPLPPRMSDSLVRIDRPFYGVGFRTWSADGVATAAADRIVVIILGRIVAAGARAGAADLARLPIEAGGLAAFVSLVRHARTPLQSWTERR